MEGFHHDLKDAKRQANAVLVDALAFFFYVESAVLACRFSGKALELEESVTTRCFQNSFRRQQKKKSSENEKLPQFYGVPRQMLVASGATIRYYPPPLETQPRSQPVFPPSTAVSQPKWVCRKTGYLKIAIHKFCALTSKNPNDSYRQNS